MSGHPTYDRLADWVEARGWMVAMACWTGSFAGCYGLMLGLLVSRWWFLLLLGIPVAWLTLRINWHGFIRRLDREYPLAAELDCSFDADAWNSALAKFDGAPCDPRPHHPRRRDSRHGRPPLPLPLVGPPDDLDLGGWDPDVSDTPIFAATVADLGCIEVVAFAGLVERYVAGGES